MKAFPLIWLVLAVGIPTGNAGAQLIHTCVNNGTGVIRVASTAGCKSNESPLSWSQTGPQGPQGLPGAIGLTGPMGFPGPQGLPGPAGSPGPAGATGIAGLTGSSGSAGVSGYTVVMSPYTDIPPGSEGGTLAQCPLGQKALGGGFRFENFIRNTNSPVIASEPDAENTKWVVTIRNMGLNPSTLAAYAICAFVQ